MYNNYEEYCYLVLEEEDVQRETIPMEEKQDNVLSYLDFFEVSLSSTTDASCVSFLFFN
jgi:hypothetical protein